jgi:O-succinylbenzoic acid--CoA ligase
MGLLSISMAAAEAPDRLALVAAGESLSFAQLASRVAAVARRLPPGLSSFRAELDVESVSRVLAALEMGRPFLPLHPRFTEAERAEVAARAEGPLPDGTQVLLATSGTTGVPKLAALSRAALRASLRASEHNLGWRNDDRWLLCMPLAHAGGLSIVTRCLAARRAVVMVPRFDPESVLDAIERHHVTLLSVVPTQLAQLLDHPAAGVLERLRAILVGGAAFPESLRRRARERGLSALATYGLTEMASQVATEAIGDAGGSDAACGRPVAGAELEIASSGRIRVRGPMRFTGYVGEAPLPRLAWLETGDLGFTDEQGRLHVLGRADDVIVTGGENVHPTEIERVLASEPGCSAALVVGLADERYGQIVGALLVPEAGSSVDAIVESASHQLASFKRPRRVLGVDALPLTRLGKPDRARARELLS